MEKDHEEIDMYVICPDCNGQGTTIQPDSKYPWRNICPRCLGKGKITWTELICRRNNDNNFNDLLMPLMRSYFPSSLTTQIVSVHPMDKPNELVYFKKVHIKEDDKL